MKNRVLQALTVGVLTTLMVHVGLGQVQSVQPQKQVMTTSAHMSEDVPISCGFVPTDIPNVTVKTVTNDVPIVKEPLMSEEDIELIALVTMAEAEGESELGKRLVIDTILNRVDSKHFPDTVADVIYQKNQFTSMWNGRASKCYVKEDICQLVKEELESRTNDEIMFFTAGEYGKHGTPIFQVGNHYFSSYD